MANSPKKVSIGFVILISLFVFSCSSGDTSDGTYHHSHPKDGGPNRHHIMCRTSTSGCYRKAERLCNHEGYLILNRIRGVQRGEHREFELRIKCRGRKNFF